MNRALPLLLVSLALVGIGCSHSSSSSGGGTSSTTSTTGTTTSSSTTSTTGTTTSSSTTSSGPPWQSTGIPLGGPYSAPPGPGSATTTVAPGVAILSLAVDPTSPSTLYVESYAQSALALQKSADGGQTWSPLTTSLGAASTFDPGPVSVDSTGNVFVSSDTGLSKSSDGGVTWTLVFPASSGTLGTLVVAPVYGGVPATLYGLGDALRSSIDGGVTWVTLTEPSGFTPLSLLAADPTTAGTLYAAADPVFAKGNPLSTGGTTPSLGGVFKSTDGGLTWQTLLSGQSDFYSGLALDSSSTIYAIDNPSSSASSPTLIVSSDGGTTWSSQALPATPVPTGTFALVVDPGQPGDLYVGAVTSISRSTDGGASWSDASQGLGFDLVNQLSLLVMDPTTSSTLYAGGVQGGLFKTTTGGQ